MKKPSDLAALEAWIAAADRLSLADVHIQMARELGLSPDELFELAKRSPDDGRAPLHAYLYILYERKFRRARPERVKPLRAARDAAREKAERRKALRRERFGGGPSDPPRGD